MNDAISQPRVTKPTNSPDEGPSRRFAMLLVALAIVVLVFSKFVAADAGMLEDETYYWLWSKNLAHSYYDHPPMVAYWVAAGTALFGDTNLGIRALAICSGVVTALATGRTAFNVSGSAKASVLAALWISVLPITALMSFLALPDAPVVMFWALAIWCLSELAKGRRGEWWLGVGLFCGLGLLSKYNTLFLGAGIVVWLIADARFRFWLSNGWPWAGGMLAALIFAPVIFWNFQHGWISFDFQFGRIGRRELQSPAATFAFWLGQALLLTPPVLVFIWGAVRRSSPGARSAGMDMLLLVTLPYLVFMVVYSVRDDVGITWLAPIYPALVAAAASTAGLWRRANAVVALLRGSTFPLAALVSLILFADLSAPRNVLPIANPVAEASRGWDGFANDLSRLARAHGAKWLATTNYNLVGQLTYYGVDGLPVVQIDERYRYSGFAGPTPETLTDPALYVVEAARVREWVLGRCLGLVNLGVYERRPGERHQYSIHYCKAFAPTS